jgi:N-acyl amino acid synthase of PEP-CTERM/exosortase system
MRLGLIQGLVRLSGESGTTHWCAVMERSLLRLLQSTAIYFQPIGPLVEHHGIRQPAAAPLSTLLRRVAAEQPEVWQFLTDAGRLYGDGLSLRDLAA